MINLPLRTELDESRAAGEGRNTTEKNEGQFPGIFNLARELEIRKKFKKIPPAADRLKKNEKEERRGKKKPQTLVPAFL